MIDEIEVILRTYHKSGRDGDRATRDKPYRDYEIVLRRPVAELEVPVRLFDGYDSFNVSIRSDQYRLAEALANQLADLFQSAVIREDYEPQVTTTWVKREQ
ncbi:hypothetical protein HOU02_gp235 [Caulobacter phage CcrBL9]|uniref:Uncharacterized protein n=1 Tax=Caulobacter phage CcrBL9 TaxID=2283270 RepID=A0A385ECV9_9CAUD|nr:hypothetical protein HOU02_gp235 [Caulobacter phage CcrBL9]AXQ69490.1 hypothetical protein CcrBL9_gp466 [Caulobacter phage CcrBL9]